jgi:hypothetical protein
MVVAQKPAQSLLAPHWPLALPIRRPRKQQDVALALVVPLGMEMVDKVTQRPPQRRNERSPMRITLDKHSSLTDLTPRSA